MSVRTFSTVLHKESDLFVAECAEVGTVSQRYTLEEAVANLKDRRCLSEEVSHDLTSNGILSPLSVMHNCLIMGIVANRDPARPARFRMRRLLAMKFYSFQIAIEKEPEDEGYFAYSPTVPRCFSNGKTIEEAKRNIREALEQRLSVEWQ